MLERKDALYESVALLSRWLEYMRKEREMVCNVAEIGLSPGQIGVVNGRVDFLVEIRSLDAADTERAVKLLQDMLAGLKTCYGEAHCTVAKPPAKLNGELIALLQQTGEDLGLEALLLPSGASHDASPLSKVMPAAMIFVPSEKGISHNKNEFTPAGDLAQGALLLANAFLRLDSQAQ
jgi:acetylornithine deacetylase/succinyl-diaminopimelate desuccinylase-like protein